MIAIFNFPSRTIRIEYCRRGIAPKRIADASSYDPYHFRVGRIEIARMKTHFSNKNDTQKSKFNRLGLFVDI